MKDRTSAQNRPMRPETVTDKHKGPDDLPGLSRPGQITERTQRFDKLSISCGTVSGRCKERKSKFALEVRQAMVHVEMTLTLPAHPSRSPFPLTRLSERVIRIYRFSQSCLIWSL